MFKLRKSKDKIDIELVGEFTPNKPSIQTYEEYVKSEETKQLKEAIVKFLETVIVDWPRDGIFSTYTYQHNGTCAEIREKLADYLIKNMEAE